MTINSSKTNMSDLKYDSIAPDMIHCIGDSHASFFSGQDMVQPVYPERSQDSLLFFRSYRLGAVLAYNLCKDGTREKGREKLFNLLDNSIPKGEKVMLCFGEIDCRFHLLRQAQKQNRHLEELVNECVDRYYSVIIEIKEKGYSVMVWNVIPSALENNPINNEEYPFFGSILERNRVAKLFNEALSSRILNTNIIMIDIFKRLVTNEGLTKSEYFFDGIHLSQKAMPFVIEKMVGLVDGREFFDCHKNLQSLSVKIAGNSTYQTGKTETDISVIVFSKDRPLQLQAYLESLLYYSGIQENSIYVLHKATDICYQDLIDKYSGVNWIAEKDFYSDLIATINQVSDFILWGCDDVLFKSFFHPEICAKSLDEDSEIFGFSLRNGKNIQPCPQLSNRGEYLLCDWTDTPEGYWSYPWEVSASVYRKKDVLDFIKLSNNISNPNYLEGELAQYFAIHKDDKKKYLACFEMSKAITLTINRVQETHPNWFDDTNNTDINSLYQYFLQGYKLNWTKLEDCNNSLVHVRSEYFELEPPVKIEPIVDNINVSEKSISITNYLSQGNELLESGQIEEAITSFQKAVESNPSSPWAYYYLGLALDKDGQFEGSVSEFERAIALDPDLIWAHHYLGETLVKLGRLEEAVGEFERAIELKPD